MSMVEVGGKAVKTWPLDTNQNLMSLAFGSLSLIWGFIIKFAPIRWFQLVSLDDSPHHEEQAKTSLASTLKKSSVMKASKK